MISPTKAKDVRGFQQGSISGADMELQFRVLVALHVGEDGQDQVKAGIEEGQEASHKVIIDGQEVLSPKEVEHFDELPEGQFNEDKQEECLPRENNDVTYGFGKWSDVQHNDGGDPDSEAPNDAGDASVRQQLVGQETPPLLRRCIVDFVSDDSAEEDWSYERQHDAGYEVTYLADVLVPVPGEEVS